MKWEEPAPYGRGVPGRWAAEAAELKANPKRWALLTEADTVQQAYELGVNIRH